MSQDLFNRFFWSIVWLQVYLGVSWYKIFHVWYFYVIALFFVIASVLESGIHCYFIHIFISNFCKFFGKCSFHTHCDVSRTRNILQNYSNFSQISFAKGVNKRFVNITFCCSLFFFRSGLKVCQGIIQPKSKLVRKFKQNWIMHQLKNMQRRKCCRDYRSKLQRQITNCNYLHPDVFSVTFAIWPSVVYLLLLLFWS